MLMHARAFTLDLWVKARLLSSTKSIGRIVGVSHSERGEWRWRIEWVDKQCWWGSPTALIPYHLGKRLSNLHCWNPWTSSGRPPGVRKNTTIMLPMSIFPCIRTCRRNKSNTNLSRCWKGTIPVSAKIIDEVNTAIIVVAAKDQMRQAMNWR